MYFVIAGKDILFHEQKSLVERLATDISTEGADRRLQVKVFKDAIHGWLERKFVDFFSYIQLMPRLKLPALRAKLTNR